MNVKAEFDDRSNILYIYVDDSLIKSKRISFDERDTCNGYFKHNKERYDFILERSKFLNNISYNLFLYPINVFNHNKISVKSIMK